ELIALGLELEQEPVVTHLAQRLQLVGHVLEVQLARHPVADLHRVPAAQAGRLRALLALQPLEAALPAAGAIDLAQQRGNLDAALNVLPHVNVNEITADLVESAGQDLER